MHELENSAISMRCSPRRSTWSKPDLPCHTGIRRLGAGSHALGRVNAHKRVPSRCEVTVRRSICGRPPSSGWRWICCFDESVSIVSLGGKAGTEVRKSALARCERPEAVLSDATHRKVVVFRPLYAVGGQELGPPAR